MTINQSSSLTESFVNDCYDEESNCSDWENENDIDFERSAFDTFIIDELHVVTYCNTHNVILII